MAAKKVALGPLPEGGKQRDADAWAQGGRPALTVAEEEGRKDARKAPEEPVTRLTFIIPSELHRWFKVYCAAHAVPMGRKIEELLEGLRAGEQKGNT